MPEHLTRAEHLQWAKDRALAYVDAVDLPSACASILSDLSKHPQIDPSAARMVWSIEAVTGGLDTADKVRRFINGIN
jgi:hypothetical protein